MTTTEKVQAYLLNCDMQRQSAPDCASQLCISDTVLRRRLRAEGTTYGALLDAERRRKVLELLEKNPHADTWKMADALGYSERNTAARTFCRLFGMGIRQFRRVAL